jgi:hypothetical protein
LGEDRKGEVKMGREWMIRGRKCHCEGENWIVVQEKKGK